MITYCKKMPITNHIELCEVTNVIELCEAIEYSLEEILSKADRYSIYYHTPTAQLRVVVEYGDGSKRFVKRDSIEYEYLFSQKVTLTDYKNFIASLYLEIM